MSPLGRIATTFLLVTAVTCLQQAQVTHAQVGIRIASAALRCLSPCKAAEGYIPKAATPKPRRPARHNHAGTL
jgi:hypothetical protein